MKNKQHSSHTIGTLLVVTGTLLSASGFFGAHAGSRNRKANGSPETSSGWTATDSFQGARFSHTAVMLPNGKVLIVGGTIASGVVDIGESYDPATGNWMDAGNLNVARSDHAATLLPNGKVLVTGGYNSGALSTVELYDPITRTWTATGSLHTSRYRHTATLLQNGKVLIAGGDGGSGSRNSAELYDPATGLCMLTGSLNVERSVYTATLLANGKVLVKGGASLGSGQEKSAELYDPATAMWTQTGNLHELRLGHTATLLPNGNVLVAGGDNRSSAELYDPAVGAWTTTGSLSTARGFHTATLLPTGQVLVAGGSSVTQSLSTAELYDPVSGVWTATGSLTIAREQHTANLLPNGQVLVTGGKSFTPSGTTLLNTAELYGDPASFLSWANTGSLSHPRAGHTATILPTGKVLVTGGFTRPISTPQAIASSELYDVATGIWTATGDLNGARYGHTATLLPNGKVLVAGGGLGGRNTAELYDPATGMWSSTGNLGVARTSHTATLLPNGQVLVTGGLNGSTVLAGAELYNPATGVWTSTTGLAAARYDHTATLLTDGRVLVAGGQAGGVALASGELYQWGTGTWSPAAGNMMAARYSHTATLAPNGRVIAAGGFNGGSYLNTIEVYDTLSGWQPTSGLVSANSSHTATLLTNGKVIIAGGTNGSSLNSATLFDLASGSRSAPGMTDARAGHTSTLLPNGKALIVGGFSGSTYLTSAELYNPGLGFADPQGRPALTRVSTLVALGGPLIATGSFFKGIGEASDGGFQSSASNTPMLQLRRVDNDQTLVLPAGPGGWSNTTVNATVPESFNQGPALVTILTNGVPSYLRMTFVQQTAVTPASASFASSGGADSFVLTTAFTVVGWTATSNASWIHLTSPAQGDGSATISYTVEFHSDNAPRSGTITVAGQTFTVLQGADFTDVSQGDLFYSFIGKLSARGITQGCGPGTYCQNDPVTRAQMAVFLERAMRGASFVPPVAPCVNGHTANFTDVPCPGSPPAFADFIEQLRSDGITVGCGAGIYCPNDPVTRAQMAIFIERALGNFTPPLALGQRFTDVASGHFAYVFVEDMAARAITVGCATGLYCPDDPVTRGQMAAFLVRGFGL